MQGQWSRRLGDGQIHSLHTLGTRCDVFPSSWRPCHASHGEAAFWPRWGSIGQGHSCRYIDGGQRALGGVQEAEMAKRTQRLLSRLSPRLQHHRTAIDPEYILTQTRSQIDIALPVRWRAPRDKLFSALSAHGQRHLAAFHWSLGQSRAPPNFSSRPTSSPYPDAHPQLALLRLPLRPLLLRAARLPATPARRLPALLVPSLPQTIFSPSVTRFTQSHGVHIARNIPPLLNYCPTALAVLIACPSTARSRPVHQAPSHTPIATSRSNCISTRIQPPQHPSAMLVAIRAC